MTFLLADISINIIFEMLFFILSNIKIYSNDCKFKSRLYTITEIFLPSSKSSWLKKREFVATTLNLDNEIFRLHITSFASLNSNIYSFYKA